MFIISGRVQAHILKILSGSSRSGLYLYRAGPGLEMKYSVMPWSGPGCVSTKLGLEILARAVLHSRR